MPDSEDRDGTFINNLDYNFFLFITSDTDLGPVVHRELYKKNRICAKKSVN